MDFKSAWFPSCCSRKDMKNWVHEIDSIYDNIIKIPKLQKDQTVEPFLTRHSTSLLWKEAVSNVIHGSYTLPLIILILLSNHLCTTRLWILWHRRGYSKYLWSNTLTLKLQVPFVQWLLGKPGVTLVAFAPRTQWGSEWLLLRKLLLLSVSV